MSDTRRIMLTGGGNTMGGGPGFIVPSSCPQTTTLPPNDMPPLPDLSHLTEEERKIIESVMARQKQEEDKEREILRKKQDEVQHLEESIKIRSEEQKKSGSESDATCQICLKTKFADGIGHTCNYCQVRCCARCGGKVSLRSSKVIWVCILCRKKQELLIKTGQWMHGGMGGQPLISKLDLDLIAGHEQQLQSPSRTALGWDKRPKLERAHSSEKENRGRMQQQPPPGMLQRSGSVQGRELRRQYSQEYGNPGGNMNFNERGNVTNNNRVGNPQQFAVSGGGMSHGDREPGVMGGGGERKLPQPPTGLPLRGAQERARRRSVPESEIGVEDGRYREMQERGRHRTREGDRSREPSSERRPSRCQQWTDDRDRQDRHREESVGPRRSRDQSVGRQRDADVDDEAQLSRTDSISDRTTSGETVIQRRTGPRDENSPSRVLPRDMGTGNVGARQQNRHPGENVPFESHSEAVNPVGHRTGAQIGSQVPGRGGQGSRHSPTSMGYHNISGQRVSSDRERGDVVDPVEHFRKNHLDPSSANSRSRGGRKKMDAVMRNDSLSSDQSESVRPPPPKPHKHKREKKQRQRSLSSSDDEIRSTPECTSCDDQEIESESVSEKGELESYRYIDDVEYDFGGPNGRTRGGTHPRGIPPLSTDLSAETVQRKTVRFRWAEHRKAAVAAALTGSAGGGGTGNGEREDSWDLPWSSNEQQQSKDSGIDTGSSATLNEENNRNNYHQHPVSWTPSPDGTRMIGHMILKKSNREDVSSSSAAILGLKVVGGRYLESGKLGALVEKVKKGSIADTVGHLRPGDEVYEWNGRNLQGKTFEEVYDIIAESKQESQVELVVSRLLSDDKESSFSHSSHHSKASASGPSSSYGSRKSEHRPSVTVTSPGSPEIARSMTQISGRIQVKLWFDHQTSQLVVTIVCAAELPPRANRQARNPYLKLVLLPDRSEKSKRRTKTVVNTNDPRWNQTFVYPGLRRAELQYRVLEISLWDYDRVGTNDFLGEVIIELASVPLKDEAEWYFLSAHNEGLPLQMKMQSKNTYAETDPASSVTSTEHLSPPSTISRLSDSDMSEFDVDETAPLTGGRNHRNHFHEIPHVGDSVTERTSAPSSVDSSSSPPGYSSMGLVGEGENAGDRRSRRDASSSSISSSQRRGRLPTVVRREDLVSTNPHPPAGPPPSTQPLSPPLSSSPFSYHSRAPIRNEYQERQMPGAEQAGAESSLVARPRSRSAAPSDVPSILSSSSSHHRSRSKSPRRGLPEMSFSRSLSPPDIRPPILSYYGMRSQIRSANSTPTGSPHKRRLPQVPAQLRKEYYIRRNYMQTCAQMGGDGMYSDSEVFNRYPFSDTGSIHHHNRMYYHPRHRHYSPEKDLAADSDLESIGSINSALSTQSERPRGSRRFSQYPRGMQAYAAATPGSSRMGLERGYSQGDGALEDTQGDGSLSDTAVGLMTERRTIERVPSGANFPKNSASGLSKKSNSTSQLSLTESATGGKIRRPAKSTPSGILRSQEVVPPHAHAHLAKQQSRESTDGTSSIYSMSSDNSVAVTGPTVSTEGTYYDFIDGLGPGQIVGRQVLAASSKGDLQLSFYERQGHLEMEVIRVRNLPSQMQNSKKSTPSESFVKIQMLDGKKCIEKFRTRPAERKTSEPFFHHIYRFKHAYKHCVIQAVVKGDYGSGSVLIGIAQIWLDDLNLTVQDHPILSWYKLFGENSLAVPNTFVKIYRRSSMLSLDSFG